MGEFRRGKSTVINALLGKEIVPSDIVPTSATLNYIRWGMEPGAQVNYKDGTHEAVSVEDLPKYITKIEEEYERVAETVDNAVVYYPCPFCKNGVEIVDTPGLNDDERMTKISEEVIPKLDAIIMVLVAVIFQYSINVSRKERKALETAA
jgi:ribosome biogenesis GTPase A